MKSKVYFLFFLFNLILSIKAYAVSDVVSFNNYSVNTVQVVVNGITYSGYTQVQYLEGVLSAEIGSWATSNHQEAFNAQAIAAQTYLENWNNNNIDASTNQPIPIPGDPNQTQAFDLNYVPGSKIVIDQGVQNAGTMVLFYPDPDFFSAMYFGSTGPFTIPSNTISAAPFYAPYLRVSPNTEPAVLIPAATSGNGVGMSQAGAFYLSENFQTAQQILFHYYHSSPPIVDSASVFQGATIFGYNNTDTHDPTTFISGGTLIYKGNWVSGGLTRTLSNTANVTANNSQDLQFLITFSEQVDFNSIGVNLVSQTNTVGVPVNEVIDFYGNNKAKYQPPTVWFGEVAGSNLGSLGAGPVTLVIQATHRYVTGGILDSDPATAALYFSDASYTPGSDTKNYFQMSNVIAPTPTPIPIGSQTINTGTFPNCEH